MNATTPEGDLWFLNTRVTIRVPATEGTDSISVLEHRGPEGDSPPLHLHHTEDELFQVLEGRFLFRIADSERRAGPGDILLVPKETPHTYRVTSADGGHWLTTTVRGDFEAFVREMGRPADRAGLPPAVQPTPEAVEALGAAAARFGIEIVGPPLH